jgi:ankyrin repeat protein
MEDSVHNLSHSLSEAFGETISRIQGLPASRSRIGMETLMYLAHAVRLLDIGELSELLAIHSGNYRGNNAKYRPSESMILQCCQGLITIDPTTLEVRVAHHSIQEFLLSNSNVLFPRATARFAVSCLRCLMSEDLRAGPWETKDEIELRLDDHPFSEYASWFWGKYAKETEQDPEVHAALTDFFSSPQAMATANQIRQYTIGYRREYWCPEESLSFTPLHFASRHGLTHTVAELLRDGAFDVNVQSKAGSTPIIQAASSNHVDIIQMLVKHGADPYLCNWYGNALHCAIEGGSAGAVRELIVGCGMDPNCCPAGYKPYLWCAIDNDSADVFELLVDLGVGKDTRTLEPLFLKACSYGCYRIVGRMIERGWADASDMSSDLGREGLRLAAGFRHLNIVKRLVEAGADVNNRDSGGASALDLLQKLYSPSRLEFVLALGSGVKAAERTGNSPFYTKKERVPLDDCNPISGSQPL